MQKSKCLHPLSIQLSSSFYLMHINSSTQHKESFSLYAQNMIIIRDSPHNTVLINIDVFSACVCVCGGVPDLPAETSDLRRPEICRVRCSRLLLICSSRLWGSGFSCTERSSPFGFHVLNWKRTENPPVADATDGSDRKLLLELRNVQATSWGCEHEKVTLPCRMTKPRTQIYMYFQLC